MYSSRPLAASRLNVVKQRMTVTKLEPSNFPIFLYGRGATNYMFSKTLSARKF